MKPLVVLVPDVFGSHLRDAAGRVWVDDEALAAGGLRRLAFPAAKVKTDGVIAAIYRTLVDALDPLYEVKPSTTTGGSRWRRSKHRSAPPSATG